ncbi:hypothetical protein, partial [Helicobacter cinaedi]
SLCGKELKVFSWSFLEELKKSKVKGCSSKLSIYPSHSILHKDSKLSLIWALVIVKVKEGRERER